METLQKIAQLHETSWIPSRTQLQKEEKGLIFLVNIHHAFLNTGFNVHINAQPCTELPKCGLIILRSINQPLLYEPISTCT